MLSIYINGDLAGTTPYATGNVNADPLTIGKHTVYTTRNFNGRLDEMRIWNTARTGAICCLMRRHPIG